MYVGISQWQKSELSVFKQKSEILCRYFLSLTSIIYIWRDIYVSPHEMGRHIVFSSVVCPSVRHTFVSALYLLNPWLDLQITLHKCQVWWDDVQCLCLTKVGSRSQFKIKHCMTVFRVRSLSFEPLVGFTNNLAQKSRILRRCAVPMFDQGRVKVTI